MPGELRMVRMRFDARGLHELGRRRRLPPRAEVGYLLHCALKELFGADAPAPFAVQQGSGRGVAVLAYTKRSSAELADHALTFAQPDVSALCDVRGMEEKVMPADWATGRRLGFAVRVCPVVRMSSAGPHWRKGAEVDAFLARCWREKGPVDRDDVYRGWLKDEFQRRGGATLLACSVTGHQREKVVRRDHQAERRSHLVERPDVSIRGELRVEDAAGFRALLARGIGRHRGFGFGMLLLVPPDRSC